LLYDERNLEQTKKLVEQNEKLINLLEYDELTHVHSRRYLMERLHEMFNLFRNEGRIFSLISIDIDNFKCVNDTYGHAMGDKVLEGMCDALMVDIPENHFISRVGGEEFIICMPDSSVEIARQKAERYRHVVEKIGFIAPNGNIFNITSSFGVVQLKSDMMTFDDLLIAADSKLYCAKQAGRNAVR
jgi:diguanylate cyclase (GGDEF)-like protein